MKQRSTASSPRTRSFSESAEMRMRDARWLRFAIRLVSSGIESQELEREEIRVHANIDVNRPYKPRKLKQDQYHKMMREAHERKPQDTAKEAKEHRVRESWERKNAPDLKKRSKFVRQQKKMLDLD